MLHIQKELASAVAFHDDFNCKSFFSHFFLFFPPTHQPGWISFVRVTRVTISSIFIGISHFWAYSFVFYFFIRHMDEGQRLAFITVPLCRHHQMFLLRRLLGGGGGARFFLNFGLGSGYVFSPFLHRFGN